MNRIIKFRAKTKADNWFYWDLKTQDTLFPEIDWNTVSQFTGLSDRAGKEIYEGDILKNEDIFGTWIGEVYWDIVSWAFKSKEVETYLPREENELEVIGNIFSNPELLNK